MLQAHVEIIDYAEGVNNELRSLAGFEPFGDLRGFKGAAKSLEKGTTIVARHIPSTVECW